MPLNIKLILSYLGTSYSGWQNSIEAVLSQTLERILQHLVKLQAASRTDAGVHAKGQVVNFLMNEPRPLSRLMHSLNGLLPHDICVLSAERMPDDFHPTLDCIKKEYIYSICNGPVQLPFFKDTSWHFPYPLELEKMQAAATHLLGRHDFSAFCNERKIWDRDPICELESIEIVALPGQRLQISVVGDHFLYKMMRNLAGTLAYAGCGKLQPEDIPAFLTSKDRNRIGMTAPAHGLCLNQVFYLEKNPSLELKYTHEYEPK